MAFIFVILFGLWIRILLFNGPFGSDDLSYLARSAEIAEGIWSSTNYIGGLRYGYNIPAGFFIYLFGMNSFTANLWTLLCSIGEIALVYIFAASVWEKRTAVIASLIIATIPLHIAVATRFHTDSVVCFFVTLSFVLICNAERKNSAVLYFLSGLAIGFVYWCKEVVILYSLAFVAYPFVFRRFNFKWTYIVCGGLVMLAGHLILMWVIAGDPLHTMKVVTAGVDTYVAKGGREDRIFYYFYYLFVEIKHSMFIGYGATFGLLYWIKQHRDLTFGDNFAVYWLIAMLVIFSLTIISVEPLRLITKQSNYLTLFFAPLSLMCGLWISKLSDRVGYMTLSIIIFSSLIFAAFEQQAYQVFVSNSKAAYQYAIEHPDRQLYGSINNGNVAQVYALLNNERELVERFGYLSKARRYKIDKTNAKYQREAYVIVDKETETWGFEGFSVPQPPHCWKRVEDIEPTGFGNGEILTGWILNTLSLFPDSLAKQSSRAIASIYRPQVATIYVTNADDIWCLR